MPIIYKCPNCGAAMEFSSELQKLECTEPYRRWEFDLENSRIRGHWTGLFTAQGTRTQIEFTECVTAKNPLMKLVLKPYLKKQQAQFVQDLKRALEAQRR